MTKRVFLISVLALLCSLCVPSIAVAASKTPSQADVTERLDYLVGLRSFSERQPLTQDRLMKLVIDLARWGSFPQKYQGVGPKLEGCDAYITHSMASLFTRSLLGERLSVWKSPQHEGKPKMVGDKLGWWYNSSNSMYDTPHVHVIREVRTSGNGIAVSFVIMYNEGNTSDNLPSKKVGAGTAILKEVSHNLVVTSWQVRRNTQWTYAGCE